MVSEGGQGSVQGTGFSPAELTVHLIFQDG